VNRAEFLARLLHGLRSLPEARRAEFLADYQSHFDEAAAAGRVEGEVADSLGNPRRLAAELVLGHEAETGAQAMPGAPRPVARPLFALLTLVMLQGFGWLPLAAGVFLVLLLIASGVVAVIYALTILVTGPFDLPLGGFAAVFLRSLAWLAAGIGALAASRAGALVLTKFFIRIHGRGRALRPTREVSP
jgi:uncharacterized membrane protein